MSEEVWEEVQLRDAAAKTWCESRLEKLIIPTNAAITQEVQRILTQHERLMMNMKGRNRADPFVIAVANLRNAVVVTGEGSDGTEARPKIPYVCQRLNIQCLRFIDIITSEGWRF